MRENGTQMNEELSEEIERVSSKYEIPAELITELYSLQSESETDGSTVRLRSEIQSLIESYAEK